MTRLQVLSALVLTSLLCAVALAALVERDLALPKQVRVAAAPSQPGARSKAALPATSAQQATTPAPGFGQAVAPGSTIRIGAVITQSGLGDETAAYKGLDAAIKEIDAQGGVKGIKLQLEVADDGSDAGQGRAQLRRLVEQDKVFALVGECAPLTDFDAGDYFQQQQIPVVGSCFAPNAQYSNPFVFPFVVEPQIEGQLMGRFIVGGLRSQKPAIVSLDVNVLDQSFGGISQGIQSAGKQVCDVQKVALEQTAYDNVVLQEKQKGCDGVVLNLDPAHTLDWMQSAQRFGYTPQRLGLTAFDSTVTTNGGSEAEGIVTYFGQVLPSAGDAGSYPAVEKFKGALARYHPEEKNINLALVGYLAGVSFGEAMAQVNGSVSRQSLIQTLESTTINNGLEPPVQFHSGNHAAATKCRFYAYHGGSFQPLTGWYG
jgi:branched-chain amino acid transport system substrate-binding protein